MNNDIGRKIRELRTAKLTTQEQLAVFLGVTPQAVSRWESQGSYPDIELLPALADYFGVTTDELLGVKKDEREGRRAEMKREFDRLSDVCGGTREEMIASARRAVAEFPSEEEFQLNLAYALQLAIWDESVDESERSEAEEEAERIYETVSETTRNINIKCEAVQGLVRYYSYYAKDDKRALELVEQLPSMTDSREFIRAWSVKDETGTYLQEVIGLCATYLAVNIKELAYDDERTNAPDDAVKVEMLQTASKIVRMIYGEDMLYAHALAANLARHTAVFQLKLGRTDDALASLEEMAKHAAIYDETCERDLGKRFSSPFLDAVGWEQNSARFPEEQEPNVCRQQAKLLENSRYDALRDEPRFRAVLEKLEAAAG